MAGPHEGVGPSIHHPERHVCVREATRGALTRCGQAGGERVDGERFSDLRCCCCRC